MRFHSNRLMTFAAIVVAGSLFSGCAGKQSGYQKAELTSKRLVDTRTEVAAVRQEVVNSVDALDALVNNAKSDLRPQYQKFEKAVDQLENRAQRARDRATDMRAKRDAYVKLWQSEADALGDPKLKERAYARMGEARQSFATLSDRMTTVRAAATPFMTNLRDLQRYLATDLTRGGIQSVSDLIATTREDETKLLAAIDAMSTEMDRVSTEMSPVAPKK